MPAARPFVLRSSEGRVLVALEDHTLTAVIAAAAELDIAETLQILRRLELRGHVERRGAECWGRR